MSSLPEMELLEVMAFIIDSVAHETQHTSRADIGIYLLSLVLKEHQTDIGD